MQNPWTNTRVTAASGGPLSSTYSRTPSDAVTVVHRLADGSGRAAVNRPFRRGRRAVGRRVLDAATSRSTPVKRDHPLRATSTRHLCSAPFGVKETECRAGGRGVPDGLRAARGREVHGATEEA